MITYFGIMGVLFLGYCVIRLVLWLEFHALPPLPPKPRRIDTDQPVTPIETGALSQRLQAVRRDYASEARTRPVSFNRPLQVRSRREELAKLAFFQKPPPVLPEHEQGWNVLLV